MEYKEYPFGENWEDAKSFVNQLTGAEAVQFFYETFGEKTLGEKGSDGDLLWKGHYALIAVSEDDESLNGFELEFVAKHDADEYGKRVHGDRAIAQFGKCSQCEILYVSYTKRLICPVCKSKRSGT